MRHKRLVSGVIGSLLNLCEWHSGVVWFF